MKPTKLAGDTALLHQAHHVEHKPTRGLNRGRSPRITQSNSEVRYGARINGVDTFLPTAAELHEITRCELIDRQLKKQELLNKISDNLKMLDHWSSGN